MIDEEEEILYSLEDLESEQFKRFKDRLLKINFEGFQNISSSELENADKIDTKKHLVSVYGKKAFDVTVMVLDKSNLRGHASKLRAKKEGQKRTVDLEDSVIQGLKRKAETQDEPEQGSKHVKLSTSIPDPSDTNQVDGPFLTEYSLSQMEEFASKNRGSLIKKLKKRLGTPEVEVKKQLLKSMKLKENWLLNCKKAKEVSSKLYASQNFHWSLLEEQLFEKVNESKTTSKKLNSGRGMEDTGKDKEYQEQNYKKSLAFEEDKETGEYKEDYSVVGKAQIVQCENGGEENKETQIEEENESRAQEKDTFLTDSFPLLDQGSKRKALNLNKQEATVSPNPEEHTSGIQLTEGFMSNGELETIQHKYDKKEDVCAFIEQKTEFNKSLSSNTSLISPDVTLEHCETEDSGFCSSSNNYSILDDSHCAEYVTGNVTPINQDQSKGEPDVPEHGITIEVTDKQSSIKGQNNVYSVQGHNCHKFIEQEEKKIESPARIKMPRKYKNKAVENERKEIQFTKWLEREVENVAEVRKTEKKEIKNEIQSSIEFIDTREHKTYRCLAVHNCILYTSITNREKRLIQLENSVSDCLTKKEEPREEFRFKWQYYMWMFEGFKKTDVVFCDSDVIYSPDYEETWFKNFHTRFPLFLDEEVLPVIALYKEAQQENKFRFLENEMQ
ncbi:uncharacterized protein LOC127526927 [Erpetoichthys calabaricus]|uniref:uncharacterized protein LOC127526927 n=1 Tax=Erpetoichthys calabaricus TaxID=27687 RepID=UPI002234858B|nr:uncharacterized protein LOC127526927 [Erpetoichthys calabaricus]